MILYENDSLNIEKNVKYSFRNQYFYISCFMHRWEDFSSNWFIVLPLFSTVVPYNICMFLSCKPFVVNNIFNRSCGCWSYFCLLAWAVELSCRPLVVITTFSTGLVGVENVVTTTNGLQDRNIHILDGKTVENKGNTIN